MVGAARAWLIACHCLHVLERHIQIGDYVLDVFNANRDAHKAVGNAKPRALFRGNRRVSHRCRMRYQCFNAAQTLGKRAEAHIIQH